jgi:hypothetical protein
VQTPYDHLANSIEWLPYSLAYIGFSFALILGLMRLVHKDELPDYPSGFQERISKKRLKWPLTLQLLLNISILAFTLLFTSDIGAVTIATLGSGALLAIVMWFSQFTTIFRREEYATILAILPAFVAIAFVTGAVEAEIALKSTGNVYRLEVKNSAPVTLILLRSLDKGVLVWDRAANQTSLIRWEQIDRISHFATVEPSITSPFVCRFTSLLCFQDEPPTP